MSKNSKFTKNKLQTLQIHILNIMYFFSIFKLITPLKLYSRNEKFLGAHLKIIGICYYANMLKEKKKKQKHTTHKKKL